MNAFHFIIDISEMAFSADSHKNCFLSWCLKVHLISIKMLWNLKSVWVFVCAVVNDSLTVYDSRYKWIVYTLNCTRVSSQWWIGFFANFWDNRWKMWTFNVFSGRTSAMNKAQFMTNDRKRHKKKYFWYWIWLEISGG